MRRGRAHYIEHRISQTVTKANGWYAYEDFALLLRRDRERSIRSGLPVALAVIELADFEHIRNQIMRADYGWFFAELVSLISNNSRSTDIKSIFENNKICVLLTDTSMENAKRFVVKITDMLAAHFTFHANPLFAEHIKRVLISTYPLSAVVEDHIVSGTPVYIRSVKFPPTDQIRRKAPPDKKQERENGTSGRASGNGVNFDWNATSFAERNLRIKEPGLPKFEHNELGNRVYAFWKRILDIVGALLGIVIFLPVILLIAAAIKLTSHGPVLFKQIRIGHRGRPFIFYKFRTMRAANDEGIHKDYVEKLIAGEKQVIPADEEESPIYKMRDDPRVTWVGRFLRKTSLDEIPQFFNVLLGSMSLVGPRPPIPYEVDMYKGWHLRRIMEAKPGITGLWQVYGRNRTNFDEMVRLDLTYVRDRSFWLDVKIILKTALVLFNPRAGM